MKFAQRIKPRVAIETLYQGLIGSKSRSFHRDLDPGNLDYSFFESYIVHKLLKKLLFKFGLTENNGYEYSSINSVDTHF